LIVLGQNEGAEAPFVWLSSDHPGS